MAGTIVISLLIAGYAAFLIVRNIKKRKKAKAEGKTYSSCGCSCSSCGHGCCK